MGRYFTRAVIVSLACISALLAPLPPAQAESKLTGSSNIATAPGLIAEATEVGVSINVLSPARIRYTNADLSAFSTRARMRFPVRAVQAPDRYSLNGALVLSNSQTGQSVTLQDVVVDMQSLSVSAGVREFFGVRITAFTITDPGRTSTKVRRTPKGRVRTTVITGVRLAVSESVGNRVNQTLGLTGSAAIFDPGLELGTANLRIVERPR